MLPSVLLEGTHFCVERIAAILIQRTTSSLLTKNDSKTSFKVVFTIARCFCSDRLLNWITLSISAKRISRQVFLKG